jgi:hypothetical protein
VILQAALQSIAAALAFSRRMRALVDVHMCDITHPCSTSWQYIIAVQSLFMDVCVYTCAMPLQYLTRLLALQAPASRSGCNQGKGDATVEMLITPRGSGIMTIPVLEPPHSSVIFITKATSMTIKMEHPDGLRSASRAFAGVGSAAAHHGVMPRR